MLGAITRALEERDQTQGHGDRVAALAEPVAARLGWDAADSLDEAIAMATSDLGRSASITYLHLPPLVIADVE